MADQRRTQRGKGPKAGRGPGRSGARTPRGLRDTGERPAVPSDGGRRRIRPRLTGRAAILVLVVAVLVVSYASSLKAYLQQRHDIKALQTEIVTRQDHIDELQSQKERWKDPAYVKQQARERFGYVMPGQVAYVALDAQGHRIQPASELGNPAGVGSPTQPTAWWTTAWGSVELAGHPPKQDGNGPTTEIGRTEGTSKGGKTKG